MWQEGNDMYQRAGTSSGGGGGSLTPTRLNSYTNTSNGNYTLTAEVGKRYLLTGFGHSSFNLSVFTSTGCNIIDNQLGTVNTYVPFACFFEATSTTVNINYNSTYYGYSAMFYQLD